MKKLIYVVLSIACFAPALLHGQYAANALDMSNLFYGGSARFVGMSGAFGAVGGDFSSLSVNPAGLGVYRNHEISFTMNVNNTRNTATYFGNTENDYRTRFNFNNFGAVFALPLQTTSKNQMQYIQFGIGYNRLKSFNNSLYFSGFNDKNSYLRTLSDYATQYGINDRNPMYPEDLAYLTNLIFSTENGEFLPDLTNNVTQAVSFVTEGAIDEMTISFGGNYADKLFFGATLGIPFMSYRSQYLYDELNSEGYDVEFDAMYYDNYYSSTAVGVNGKFGLIYKPIQELRVGVSVHTPTYYGNIDESQLLAMQSVFWDSTQWNRYLETPTFTYQYTLNTPMRVVASAATVIGKVVIISADYEWVDHSKNRLSGMDRQLANDENNYMRDYYKSQHIVRAGAEVNIKNFYLRGGYGWYSSPYQNNEKGYGSVNSFSAGVGFRVGAFGLDFAYQHARTRSYYSPYNADPFGYWDNDPSPEADVLSKLNNYMLTLSFRY